MDKINIEVCVDDESILLDFFGNKNPSIDQEISLGNGIALSCHRRKSKFRGSLEQIILLVLTIPVGISTNIISSILYEKFKSKKVNSIKIDGKEVRNNQKEIENALTGETKT
ncbi:MAG: hypothetical protein NT166_10345 [Candidatus Aminicenantes bacterium]|nr:hypothetical protein [Candidatus Aminicenantes bacterium]